MTKQDMTKQDTTKQGATKKGATKKVFIKSYGCQMNVYDGQRMADVLAGDGYAETSRQDEADLVILNTCHIREKAVDKVYSELGRVREIKTARAGQGLETRIVVAGCVAQAEGAEIQRRQHAVDLVVGPQSYHRLPDLLARSRNRRLVDTEFPVEDKFGVLPEPDRARTMARGVTAFLTVQEGCDKFCAFCVVPYTRGAELSRPVERIMAEARKLAEAGVKELTLIGQNVNAYHGEGPDGRDWSLARLIQHLADIDGLERLRYTTSHPRDMGDDLIAAHRTVGKLMPYLHLPVQAGSDRILAAMNRKHTAVEYLALVDRIRSARPEIALSTDIIVGFPSETESEFEESLEIVRAVGFAQAYSFKYSARPGTPAATMDGQLSEEVKSARLARLQDLLDGQQSRFNKDCIGKVLPVLFERPGRHSGQIVGRSPYLQLVHAEAPSAYLGRILPVEISAAGSNSLSGVIQAA